jgi:benzoyl-CoA reductase/2-hydroxyglutaryl-CoA dehydratase subunit BcrC/BadD/HgdB
MNLMKPVYTIQSPESGPSEDFDHLKRDSRGSPYLEEIAGRPVTDEDIRRSIALRNRERMR